MNRSYLDIFVLGECCNSDPSELPKLFPTDVNCVADHAVRANQSQEENERVTPYGCNRSCFAEWVLYGDYDLIVVHADASTESFEFQHSSMKQTHLVVKVE